MTSIGFIGVGEIASAMVEGLARSEAGTAEQSASQVGDLQFFLSPRNADRAKNLAESIESATVCESNQDVVDRSDLIVLAVLPQQAADVLDELSVRSEKTLVCAVAGVSTDVLNDHLPHSPTTVRIIPLPAVRERKGVTAMYPANDTVEALLGHLGGSVTAADETMFSTLSAVTATMSTHFAFLQTITAWLVDRGWDQADADHFIRGQFVGLGTTLAETTDPINDLVAAHETPGGLNEMVNREWMNETNRADLAATLDRVFNRVTGSD
ncbi:NAD(P)-binding domain-containing protein [Brevibacterium spongiae]|uniref:NAD(P)-binding domain-containing protein n=1 Tax=Brevibacterium spongiae TaxID=2909672 RepID=A0ABY5SL19_9MICO|nr:NAD(P)-binding domain-containing protein [Brevibacterium spongiae]UVI35232.1 NAD(P)-binding domain-containing protein [Brevibacterium spongiae]